VNPLPAIARAVLPSRLRQFLRAQHRAFVFRRAMKRFLIKPEACLEPGNTLVTDLIYGWGNELWSALDEYLVSCVEHALASPGPVLECGSGLSTIVVGAIAQRRGYRLWALEHTPEWFERVQRCLDRYHIDSVVLHLAPLTDYGEFVWYDPPCESMPGAFALVLCDGPPGSTKGGRYGLVPVMKNMMKPGCVIVLDDAGRIGEQEVAGRWKAELGSTPTMHGRIKPYITITVSSILPDARFP
jgi:hypothetical protein